MSVTPLLVVSLVIIVAGSELFTNAVEWAGFRLRLGGGATGSLLAALGTALPETTVPVVAIAGRGPKADDVAVGALLGAPFLLLTLGVAVTGITLMTRRPDPVLHADRAQIRRDLGAFLLAFSLLLVCVALPQWARVMAAVALLCHYATYVRRTLTAGDPGVSMPEPLHLVRWREQPPGMLVAVQLLVAIGALIGGAELFVRALEQLAGTLHFSALLLSLVLVPLATEMPETLNSVLWVRSRDDRLAAGNLLGATAFQACIPGALVVAVTTWSPGHLGLLSAGLTLLTGLWLYVLLRNGTARGRVLLVAALPWVAFTVLVATAGTRLQGA